MTQVHSTPERLLRTATVPRYTSYPPANRFDPTVGAVHQLAWLRAVPLGTRPSLYVHIPFCRRLCHFCACRTQGTRTGAPIDAYLDRLIVEMRRVAAELPTRMTLSALHLGGGTPTLLSPKQIDRLAGAIRRSFGIGPCTEVAVEVDPTELDAPRLAALQRLGLTRASIGVQDFEPQIQDTIGREQSVAQTAWAVEQLRAHGARSLNMDLVYGLPHQTPGSLSRTIAAVTDSRPDRVALYGYAHVPSFAARQRLIPSESLPDGSARLALFEAAGRQFRWAGYHAVGIDHFAVPKDSLAWAAAEGRLHRNFQGYTTDAAPVLIGVGASAVSRYPQGYVQNAAATGAWSRRIDAGQLGAARGHEMNAEDQTRATVIERLMCDFSVDLEHAAVRHGTSLQALLHIAEDVLAELPGEATLDANVLRLTRSDGRFARLVCRHFDSYAGDLTATHSAAI